jgi:hypothetical protein
VSFVAGRVVHTKRLLFMQACSAYRSSAEKDCWSRDQHYFSEAFNVCDTLLVPVSMQMSGPTALLNALPRILPFDRTGTTFVRSMRANSGSQERLSWRRSARPPASSRIVPMPVVPIPAIRIEISLTGPCNASKEVRSWKMMSSLSRCGFAT